MAQSVSVTVAGKDGNAFTATKVVGFPTQGVVISAMTAKTFGSTSCVTEVLVLATGERYYSGTATATVITAANA